MKSSGSVDFWLWNNPTSWCQMYSYSNPLKKMDGQKALRQERACQRLWESCLWKWIYQTCSDQKVRQGLQSTDALSWPPLVPMQTQSRQDMNREMRSILENLWIMSFIVSQTTRKPSAYFLWDGKTEICRNLQQCLYTSGLMDESRLGTVSEAVDFAASKHYAQMCNVSFTLHP